MDRHVNGFPLRFEQRHAFAAARHEHRLRSGPGEQRPSGALQRLGIIVYLDAEGVLDL